jgi:hypothetical protein
VLLPRGTSDPAAGLFAVPHDDSASQQRKHRLSRLARIPGAPSETKRAPDAVGERATRPNERAPLEGAELKTRHAHAAPQAYGAKGNS